MKKSEIEIGGKYVARVSGVFVTVRVDEIIEPVLHSKHVYAKGMGRRIDRTAYHVTNLRTGRPLTFKSAAKFRSVARPDGAEAPDSKIVRTTIAYNRELSEYKVKGYNAAGHHYEPADYFTDSRDDAEATAKRMVSDG